MKTLIYIFFFIYTLQTGATSRGILDNYVYSCDKMLIGQIQKYETELQAVEKIDYDIDFNPNGSIFSFRSFR